MALHDLNRSNDTPIATLKVDAIVPKNWHRFPSPISKAMTDDIHLPVITFTGGAYGDDVSLSTANSTDAYEPKTQAAKAALPGGALDAVQAPLPPGQLMDIDYVLSTDITAPRGYIGPSDPYSKAVPAAPVISSLAPNTVAAGTPSPLAVTITGTGFTQWSTVLTGGVETPYVTYFSPTKIVVLMDPKRSVAGTIGVIVRDHSVNSNTSNFVYT